MSEGDVQGASDEDIENDHVEQTVQRMAELHARHQSRIPPLRRAARWATRVIASPVAIAVALVLILGWIGANAAAARMGWKAPDPPPFALLELVATVAAFLTTLLILATQMVEEEASRHRSQLTLQLASLSEQKIAKVIELLEEQRRENPQLASRGDPEAEEMAHPADPAHVLERIRSTHDD